MKNTNNFSILAEKPWI